MKRRPNGSRTQKMLWNPLHSDHQLCPLPLKGTIGSRASRRAQGESTPRPFITTALYLLNTTRRNSPDGSRGSRANCKKGREQDAEAYGIHGLPQGGAAWGSGGVDDGADLRGLGHEERPRAGLLHGLLQDPRDAQAEQARALPGQPRRRRRPPRPAAQGGAGPGRQGRRIRPGGRRPPPATPHRTR